MRKIILASASPRRRELLAGVGATFQICRSNGEENITKEDPDDIVKELSLQKATTVAEERKLEEGTVIIGADTIVFYEGKILGKPADEEDAVHTLQKLQDNTELWRCFRAEPTRYIQDLPSFRKKKANGSQTLLLKRQM